MRQWTIDAFATAPFRGNQACVVEPFDAWPDAGWMQALAAENNQAETAFLLKTAESARFGLRWFTPALEVPLCGHATLASGHVLFAELGLAGDEVTFDTQSGPLTVSRASAGYEMDFPADNPMITAAPDGLTRALGEEPIEVWAAQYLIAVTPVIGSKHAINQRSGAASFARPAPQSGAPPARTGVGRHASSSAIALRTAGRSETRRR